MRRFTGIALVVAVLISLVWGVEGVYAFSLLDGKLEMRGNIQHTLNYRTNQDILDVEISSSRTNFRTDALYRLLNCPDRSVEFHFLGHYYYDAALDIDVD